jgi:chorismate mutase
MKRITMAITTRDHSPEATWIGLALSSRRDEIAAVDAELARLLKQRAHAARQLGRVKREAGMPVVQPAQEAEVLRRWERATAGLDKAAARRIVEALIEICRAAQLT